MGSGASKEALGDLHVVIIGGGYGGVQAAASLRNAGIKFTIIDPKEYFHHCYCLLVPFISILEPANYKS